MADNKVIKNKMTYKEFLETLEELQLDLDSAAEALDLEISDIEAWEEEDEIPKSAEKWVKKEKVEFAELHNTNEDDIKISPENVESFTGFCFNLYSEQKGNGVKFKSGDILFNKLRLYLVKIIMTSYDGFSMGEMITIRMNKNVLNKYTYLRNL